MLFILLIRYRSPIIFTALAPVFLCQSGPGSKGPKTNGSLQLQLPSPAQNLSICTFLGPSPTSAVTSSCSCRNPTRQAHQSGRILLQSSYSDFNTLSKLINFYHFYSLPSPTYLQNQPYLTINDHYHYILHIHLSPCKTRHTQKNCAVQLLSDIINFNG